VPHPPHDDFEELVRRSYVRPLDEDVAARHLTAIAAAAREQEASPHALAPSRQRRRLGLAWRPALATGLAALVLPTGLAVAGVDLPDPVNAPFDAVGIELPNQSSSVDAAPATPPAAVPASQGPRDAGPSTAPGRTGETGPSTGERGDDRKDAPRDGTRKDRGTRRNEDRSGGRRGDEASDGRRQGGERGRNDEAPSRGPREDRPKPAPRSEERSGGRRGVEQRQKPRPAPSSRGKRTPAPRPDRTTKTPPSRSTPAPRGPKSSGESQPVMPDTATPPQTGVSAPLGSGDAPAETGG
jgi:hypothetical protein